MIIDCIADLHGSFPTLDGGDLLIVAGDLTAHDIPSQYDWYNDWLAEQAYTHKITIAGNHDGCIERKQAQIRHGTYLHDTGTQVENIRCWGSPFTPTYHQWHFMRARGQEIKAHWDLIPDGIDLLITHGPAFGVLDKNQINENCGCQDLLEAVERIKPRYHIFGHIHEGYGMKEMDCGTIAINCAQMDGDYEMHSRPVRIVL